MAKKKQPVDLKKKVENLAAPTRTGAKVTAKWEVPAESKKADAPYKVRMTGLDMLWVFDADPKNGGHEKKKGDVVARDATNKNTQRTDTETIPRKKFYPFKGKPKLVNAEFWVRGYNTQTVNSKSVKVYGPWAHKAITFSKPDKPSISLTYNDSTGKVTASYTTDNPNGAKERYDTAVTYIVADSKKIDGSAYEATEKSLGSYDVPGALGLNIGQYLSASLSAYNRGLRGNSGTASETVYICHPNVPVCGTPTLLYAEPDVLSTAMVKVPVTGTGSVKAGSYTIHATELVLQRLKNSSTATNAASAAADAGWSNVTTDDGESSGMTDTWANAVSDAGKYTWYRLAAKRNGYTTYSVPVQAKCINVLSSSGGQGAATISVAVNADGKSATATLSGKLSTDAGYEVSWSDASDAWVSTAQPDTFLTTGSSLVVKGLTEGTEYFFRARAYSLDSDGNPVFGTYSATVNKTPYTTPSTVILSGAKVTPRGSDLLLTWVYDTESTQTQWRLVDSSGKAKFSGKGGACSRVIKPKEYGSASSLTLRVEMTTGGGWAASKYMTFTFADAPTCSINAAATITAQPYSFTVSSDKGDTVNVSLTALGSSGTGLYGDPQQYNADTVHANEYAPMWATSGGVRSATIELPSGLALFSGARYLLDVTVTDRETGMESATASAVLTVDWAHRAQQPIGTAVPDADSLSVTVTVNAPQDYAEGDRFDLYRVTPDGERRIAAAQPFGTSITDRLAPYSSDGENLAYIAVTRTADGDACIGGDIEYELASSELRFDWAEQYVELPYNLALADDIAKDVEVRAHLDGSHQAYWNQGHTRKATLSTDLIRFEDHDDQVLLRDMLHHAGSVFVRTPNGMAFAADVNPGTIESSASSALVGVSLNATEHDLTDEGRPQETDIVQPAYTGGAIEAHNGVVYDSTGGYPLDDWQFIGYSGQTLYAADEESAVHSGDGTLLSDWTWNGITLYDANGDEVEVTEEAEE